MFKFVTETTHFCENEASVCLTSDECKLIAAVGESCELPCVRYIRAKYGVGFQFALDVVTHIQQDSKLF